ncbi:MAG: MFS transporter [Polyangiaceae bacterium]
MKRAPSLGAIFLTVFLDLLGFGLVLPFLGEGARDTFGSTEFVGSLLASVYSLMQFLFVPVWGRLSDRIGRRPVLLWSVFASILGWLGLFGSLTFGHSVVWLFLTRAFSGIATANLGTASAYIADVTKPEERAKGMGLIGAAFGLGFIIGPGIGGALAKVLIHGRAGGVPCLVAAALAFVNFLWVLRGVPVSLPPEKRAPSKRRLAPLDLAATKRTLQKPGIAAMVLINFVAILAFTCLDQTFRFFNKDIFGFDQLQTGLVLMLIGVSSALVQGLIVRKLSGKVADVTLVRAGLFIQAVGFLLLALTPSIGAWSLYVVGAILALGNGLSQPSTSAYISRRSSSAEQGETLGTSQSFASLARMFGPALGGFLYGSIGPRSPYVASALGMIVGLLLATRLSKQPPVPEAVPSGPDATPAT